MKPDPPDLTVDIEDYRWLIGPDAARWLTELAAEPVDLPRQAPRLRKALSAARTHLVLEQCALRRRAIKKFTAAERMFFTPRSLEQATDEVVADHKAKRLTVSGSAADLCCGIGGDLMALAAHRPAVGVDRDPILTLLAAANWRAAAANASESGSQYDVRFQTGGAEDWDVGACSAWHIDPDRRPADRRTTRVELHEPGADAIDRLLARNANAAIKLAPAAVLPSGWEERAELEWISHDRECRQLVAWFGGLTADSGQRRATVLGGPRHTARSIVGTPGDDVPLASGVGRYLFEPDSAVLAADLGAALAAEHRLTALAPGVAYWTADRPIDDPALACFEVLEVMPFRLKRVRGLLRERRVGRLEVKKRGVEQDPEAVRRQLELRGDESAVLLLWPEGQRVMASIARRLAREAAE